MKNTATTHFDGLNVYVNSQVKSHPVGKFIIAAFTIFVGVVLLYAFAKADPEKIGGALVPLFLFSILFFYFILRYTLWNWCGKETIIINKKSLSYKLDYGLYQTNLKTISYSRFGFSSEIIQNAGNLNFGRVYFFNYRDENDLPEKIYQTSILLPEQQLAEIKNQIELLYAPVQPELNQFPYSLN